jgi:hypothetical protein
VGIMHDWSNLFPKSGKESRREFHWAINRTAGQTYSFDAGGAWAVTVTVVYD